MRIPRHVGGYHIGHGGGLRIEFYKMVCFTPPLNHAQPSLFITRCLLAIRRKSNISDLVIN